MKSPTHNGTKNFVILRASDKDARRTSTSTLGNKFNRITLAASESGFLFAAICYLVASYRLLITDY
jgi:hypothetical protein